MVHWGISYASGPNYNLPWVCHDPKGRQMTGRHPPSDAMQGALAHAGKATPVQPGDDPGPPRARYPQREAIEDMAPWDKAYTREMRKVFAAFPDDLEVLIVFAEPLMNETPWQMWDLPSGKPAEGAGSEECRAVLEYAFEKFPAAWDHPGLLHLYVHLMEMSPFPQRALRAGDRLREIVPDILGHLIHMPTHLDVLCGHYNDVLVHNQKALATDRRFLAYSDDPGVDRVDVIHDFHFAIYGAMFLGQYTPAIAAAEELIATIPEAALRIGSLLMADFLEGYLTDGSSTSWCASANGAKSSRRSYLGIETSIVRMSP